MRLTAFCRRYLTQETQFVKIFENLIFNNGLSIFAVVYALLYQELLPSTILVKSVNRVGLKKQHVNYL